MTTFFTALMIMLNSGDNFQRMPVPGSEKAVWSDLYVVGDTLWACWTEQESRHKGTIQIASFENGAWNSPVSVTTSKRLFINWADFPKLAVSGQNVMVAWPQMVGEGTYAYVLMYAWSQDGGKSFTKGMPLQDDLSEKEHGFVSLAATGSGAFRAVWLDGREMADSEGHESHDGHGQGGAMTLRTRIIQGNNRSPEVVLDDKTCECCGIDLLVDGDRWWATYRDRSEKEVRDIYMVRGHGKKVEKGKSLFNDAWIIHGCPVNGPAMARHQDTLAVAWFSGTEPAGVRLAWIHALSGDLIKQLIVSTKTVGRVDLAFDSEGGLVLSCVEDDGVVLYRYDVDRSLEKRQVICSVPNGRSSGFPRLVHFQERFVLSMPKADGKGLKMWSGW